MAEELSWREFSVFVEEITSARSCEEFLTMLLPAAKKIIPCGVAATLIDNHGICLTCVGFCESTVEAYNSHYVHTLDMLPQTWQEIRAHGSRFDVLNWDSMSRSEFASDFALPNGIRSTLAHFTPGLQWSLCLHRGRGEPPFSNGDRSIIVAANRQVNQLYRLYNRLEQSPSGFPDGDRVRRSFPGLSPREALVCSLYCLGISAPAIASKLHVSRRTVEAQIGAVYLKLQVSSKTDLMRTVGTRFGVPDQDARVAFALG